MRRGYYCYTTTMAEECLQQYRAELVGQGMSPEEADRMVEGLRQFHASRTAEDLKMFIASDIKTT